MMNKQSYLIFELAHSLYGIPTSVVQELFLLPDVVPVPETPPYVVGVINLRGEILPIIDLQQRLGQTPLSYQPTDNIIVVQWQHQRLGILVNQVREVEAIAVEQLQLYSANDFMNGRSPDHQSDSLTVGIASLDTALITLINPEFLVRSSIQFAVPSSAAGPSSSNGHLISTTGAVLDRAIADPDLNRPFAHLPIAAQQILQARAENLRQPIATQDVTGIPIAVIGLGGEYLGLGLETVYEFTPIRNITPVPCCPPHILGNMNLRGEIVTLVDISQVVNLPLSASRLRQMALIVRLDQLTAGIAVDEIFDLIYLDPALISAVPVAVHSANDEYLQGVAPYKGKMMSIINLSKILTSDVLVVNEEV